MVAFNVPLLLVMVGVLLSLTCAAIVGAFSFLQQRELIGDIVAHALLPGMAFSLLLYGVASPLLLTIGGVGSGMLALLLVDYLWQRTRLSQDGAMACVLSLFFGLGLVVLTYIQQRGRGVLIVLEHYLLGKTALLMYRDIQALILLASLLLVALVLFLPEWRLMAFDLAFAHAVALPLRRFQWLFRVLTLWTIVLGAQTIGIVLMNAMLIIPVVIAQYWTRRLHRLLCIAVASAHLMGVMGVGLSYCHAQLPAGASIVLVGALLALCSFVLSPRGFLANRWRQYRYNLRVRDENLLKALYAAHQGLREPQAFTVLALQEALMLSRDEVVRGLRRLASQRLVVARAGQWWLTRSGRQKGSAIARRHLLWEAYARRLLRMHPDSVHHDAEIMEHIITPDIEASIRQVLSSQEVPKA